MPAGHFPGSANIVTDHEKPVLDEHNFARLLEAAYVMQEHNRKLRELEESLELQSEQLRERERVHQEQLEATQPILEEGARSAADYTLTLAQIVEAQHQIQIRHLALDQALQVVAERVARIANASGAAIGILDGKMVRYRAGAGSSALPIGSEVPLSKTVCQANIRTGQVIRAEDVNIEILFDPEPCLRRGILSLVAVPVYHDGDIVGALELYFGRSHGYAEQDIHTCQLMAGLVTEAIGRDAQLSLRNSMATERSTILRTAESLNPDVGSTGEDQPSAISGHNANESTSPSSSIPCSSCGRSLLAEEQFCGRCGASRTNDKVPYGTQNKVESPWHSQQASQIATAASGIDGAEEAATWSAAPPHEQHRGLSEDEGAYTQPLSVFELDENAASVSIAAHADDNEISLSAHDAGNESDAAADSTALVVPQPDDVVWSSAATAREFLESLSGTRAPGALARFWRSRRGDFYLAVALILVVVVIRWGIWSENSVGATGHGTAVSGSANRRKQVAPDADLSTFDRLLISLGLAEPPDQAPEYKGNPETRVWVDLQTALYYCPGSDLYGKTPKGKISSQRDAQLDQFEPASRKACD